MTKTYYIIEEYRAGQLINAYCALTDDLEEAKKAAKEASEWWPEEVKVKLIMATANEELDL